MLIAHFYQSNLLDIKGSINRFFKRHRFYLLNMKKENYYLCPWNVYWFVCMERKKKK